MNPLLLPFDTLHETAPFSKIHNEHFLPAFRAAIEEGRKEIDSIILEIAPPSFENTIEALEKSGRRLDIIQNIFFNLNSAETSDEIQDIAQKVSPLLSEYSSDISLNEDLFKRIRFVVDNTDEKSLTVEQQTLLKETYLGFVRSGANLDSEAKKKYREIKTRLSKLSLSFQENVLAETNAFSLNITNKDDLSGLPEFILDSALQTAMQRKEKGWTFTLQAPSYIPFMKYASNRKLREKMFRAFSSRGNNGNENDNKAIIREIVNLKHELAKLLGYHTYADCKLEKRMAETPSKVEAFINELHEVSRPAALKEFDMIQHFAEETCFKGKIERWDWAYYAEKVKNEKFGFSDKEVKPYFKLENVISGVFGLARKLYGLQFKENPDIQVYHPDVIAYEIFDPSNKFIAVLYADFFPRDGKRPGAWMTDFRSQYAENGQDVRPHISIVMNFTKPIGATPSLLTFEELTVFLHEFGHSLHGMLSKCQYSSISGTNVYHDFVELPSQMHENWAYEKEWLDSFAIHYQTGEIIPAGLVDKIIAAKNYLVAFNSERQLSFGMLDMAYHRHDKAFDDDISIFERKAMAPTELFEPVEGSLMSTSFSHIFAGGYDAGYYSYKWAESLEADAFSVFLQNGIFDKATADSFRTNILEKGGSEHPMILYKRFKGQEPTIDALLKRSGLK